MQIVNRLWAALGLALAFAGSPALAQDASPTLDHIRATGTLNIGYREASQPFSFIDDQRKVRGFSIDLCERVAAGIKKTLGLAELRVSYIPVTPQTRIPLIANNTIDLECGSTTINASRQNQVDFSVPFFVTGSRFAVRKASGLKQVEDMAGKSVGFAQGTTDERAVRAVIDKQGIKNVRIVNFPDHAQGILALETDRIDAYAADDVLLASLIARSRQKDAFQIVGRALTFSPYGLMMRRNDSAFRLTVNRSLAETFRSGDIDAVFQTWFAPLGVEMSPELRTTFALNAWDE